MHVVVNISIRLTEVSEYCASDTIALEKYF